MSSCQELKIVPILDPLTCGFVKVITFEVLPVKHTLQQRSCENLRQFKHRILDNHYYTLHSVFGNAISMYHLLHFATSTIKLKSKYEESQKRKDVLEKNEIMNVFDQKTWSQLSPEKKVCI